MSDYFLPDDITRCSQDDCALHLKCARWLDRLPFEAYRYAEFGKENCTYFIEKNIENDTKKSKKVGNPGR